MHDNATRCELCADTGGIFLWQNDLCRIVLVPDDDFPGFCRVILNHHRREMSDLPCEEQSALMRIVFALETVVRDVVRPDKINLASLGNVTPHIHWHVIPRWHDDCTFPAPIWAPRQRWNALARPSPDVGTLQRALVAQLGPTIPATPSPPG